MTAPFFVCLRPKQNLKNIFVPWMLDIITTMKKHLLFTSLLLVMAVCLASCSKTVVVPEKYCEELVKLAEDGNAEAQAKLGKCYIEAEGVEESVTEGIKWLSKAVEQGNSDAQVTLGKCYLLGLGVEQSNEKGLELIRKAAEKGNADGQFTLGNCYFGGKLLAQSNEKAVEWFRKAADQGNADGQAALGICYFKGFGVEQSYAKAVELFETAQGKCAAATYMLGLCMINGFAMEKNVDEGLKLVQKAANDDYAPAKADYGLYCYKLGNYDAATSWLATAAILGNQQGIDAINTWIKQRAKNGSAEAQFWMGRYCESEKQYEQAIHWYTLAAEQGDAYAPKFLQELQAKLQKSK